jgi:hypothetical protein
MIDQETRRDEYKRGNRLRRGKGEEGIGRYEDGSD